MAQQVRDFFVPALLVVLGGKEGPNVLHVLVPQLQGI